MCDIVLIRCFFLWLLIWKSWNITEYFMSGRSGNQLVLFSSSPVRVTRENTACCFPQNLTFSVYYRLSYITSNNWKKTTLTDISSLLKDFVRATPRITLHSLKKTGKNDSCRYFVFIKRFRQGNSFVSPYIQTLFKCIAMFWLPTVKGFSVEIGSKPLKK